MTAPEQEFDRARFDDSMELATTQLAFPQPDIDDEERKR